MTQLIPSILVSPEEAVQLKLAAFPQYDTMFTWENQNGFIRAILSSDAVLHSVSAYEYYAAPTASEIMEKLPSTIHLDGVAYGLYVAKISTQYCVYYMAWDHPTEHDWTDFPDSGFQEPTLADALSKMYCLLAERNLLPAA